MNYNKVTLVGRVARDPELKHTQSGQTVCSFGLATNRDWKKDNVKHSKTEWHNLVFWGKLAEIVGQYVTKGQELLVTGRIEYREYEAKDGHKVKTTDIVVEDMQMGARTRNAEESASRPAQRDEQPAPAEEIPTINIDEEPKAEPYSSRPAKEEEEIRLEDVPF